MSFKMQNKNKKFHAITTNISECKCTRTDFIIYPRTIKLLGKIDQKISQLYNSHLVTLLLILIISNAYISLVSTPGVKKYVNECTVSKGRVKQKFMN